MDEVCTLGKGKKAKKFRYEGSLSTGVVLEQSGSPRIDAAFLHAALRNFAGQTVKGGFQEDDPPKGGFGEWVQNNSEELNSRKLGARHASFVAALLCRLGPVTWSHLGNAVLLHFPKESPEAGEDEEQAEDLPQGTTQPTNASRKRPAEKTAHERMSTTKPEEAWRAALESYRYPVDLRDYRYRAEHEGSFAWTTGEGRREETIAFEDHFRQHAPCAIEPWAEVIFWKLANQPQIRNGTTQRIASSLYSTTTAGELWHRCGEYVLAQGEAEARAQFEAFLKLFGLKTDRIPIVATFPAFMDPKRFPMVDRRVAAWVKEVAAEQNCFPH